jgi:hypothetical protein
VQRDRRSAFVLGAKDKARLTLTHLDRELTSEVFDVVVDTALDLSVRVDGVNFRSRSYLPRRSTASRPKPNGPETHPSSFFVSSLSAGSISALAGALLDSMAAAIFWRRPSCSVDLAWRAERAWSSSAMATSGRGGKRMVIQC